MKITIQKFNELYKIGMMDVPDIDKSTLLVRQFTGMTEQEINKMKLSRFNRLCKKIQRAFDRFNSDMHERNPKQFIWIGLKCFKINYDFATKPMNAGRYVEFATFSDDVIGNLHRIMASMCSPVRLTWRGFKFVEINESNHERISNMWLNANFEHAYHSCVFFYAIFNKSIQNLVTFSQTNNPEPIPELGLIMSSTGILDGYIRAKWYRNLRD
jgi:hypothetical protein